MKMIEPQIEILIDKLTIAAELYNKAADRVHNDMMKEQFELQSSRKQDYIDQISNLLDLDLNDHKVNRADRLKIRVEKLGVDIDHFYLRQNAKEALSFCLNREDELIDAYRSLIKSGSYDNHLKLTLKSQLDDSVRIKDELNTLHEEYDFQEA